MKRRLSDSKFRNIEYIINSGGEPTLEPLLIEYLKAEHEALPKAKLQLSTNGLLPEKVIQAAMEMRKVDVCLDVGLSLDGVGSEHDRIRGVQGNFEKIDQLIKNLYGIANVTAGATLTDQTIHDNMEAYQYARQHQLPFLYHWLNESTFYSNQNCKYTTRNIQKAVMQLPKSLYRKMWLESLNGKKPQFKCKALQTFAVLKADGSLAPCLTFWNYPESEKARQAVKNCEGCLNNWAVNWSLQSYPLRYPLYLYALRRKIFADKL